MPLKLYKRKDRPSWSIRGTVCGTRVEESTGTTDRGIADEIRIKREHELQSARIHGKSVTATWAEAVNLYLDGGRKGRFLVPLSRYFGLIELSKIDQVAVNRAARTLYPNASNATVARQVITPVSAVLNRAHKAGYCKKPNFDRPILQNAAARTFVSQDWLAAFVRHASPRLGAIATFMAFTGARIGEAVALDWSTVFLRDAEVLIPWTKTGKPRRVALADIVVAALANLEGRTGRVFGWEHRWSVYKPWRAACAAAGIQYIPPHQAGRHTFASWLLADGYSLKVVADAGGWKSIKLVADTYGHLERDHIDNAIRSMGRHRDVGLSVQKKARKVSGLEE